MKEHAQFSPGVTVHVDTDNQDWGRVASDGIVEACYADGALVNVDSIKAGILVPFEDMTLK